MNLDTIRKACEFSARRNKQLNDLELASIHANVDLPKDVYKELDKTRVQMRRLRRGYELRLKAATYDISKVKSHE